jgi:hypothetical protein
MLHAYKVKKVGQFYGGYNQSGLVEYDETR